MNLNKLNIKIHVINKNIEMNNIQFLLKGNTNEYFIITENEREYDIIFPSTYPGVLEDYFTSFIVNFEVYGNINKMINHER
jgi:hypothetical protein